MRALARSSSSRTRLGEPHAHRRDAVVRGVGRLDRRAPGCRPPPARSRSASARSNGGVSPAVEAADVEVVDHLVDAGRRRPRRRSRRARRRRRRRARRAPPGRSRGWWRSSRRRSRRRRARAARAARATSSGGPARAARTTSSRRPGTPASTRASACSVDDQPLAHALAQLAGRHAGERDEQQLVERRCPRRRSAPPARRSCTSCRCRRSPRARSRRSAAGRRRRTARRRSMLTGR